LDISFNLYRLDSDDDFLVVEDDRQNVISIFFKKICEYYRFFILFIKDNVLCYCYLEVEFSFGVLSSSTLSLLSSSALLSIDEDDAVL